MIPSTQTVLNLSDAYTAADLEFAIRSGDMKLAVEISFVLGAQIGRESFDVYETEEYKDLKNEIGEYEDLENEIEDKKQTIDDLNLKIRAEREKGEVIPRLAAEIEKLKKEIAQTPSEAKIEIDFLNAELNRYAKICVDLAWDAKLAKKFLGSPIYNEMQARNS